MLSVPRAADFGEIEEGQRPSIGGNIKWRPGNQPNYFTGRVWPDFAEVRNERG